MSRKYVSNPCSKSYRKINTDDLGAASAEAKNELSLRNVAENHKLHYTTLQRYIKSNGKRRIGGQTVLCKEVEKIIAEKLGVCALWGYPLDTMKFHMIVKNYLDRKSIIEKRFKILNIKHLEKGCW